MTLSDRRGRRVADVASPLCAAAGGTGLSATATHASGAGRSATVAEFDAASSADARSTGDAIMRR